MADYIKELNKKVNELNYLLKKVRQQPSEQIIICEVISHSQNHDSEILFTTDWREFSWDDYLEVEIRIYKQQI